MSFTLLQKSLGQTISLTDLEEASMVTRRFSKPDCSALQQNLFGVFACHLGHKEALAFQMALNKRGFPTEVVEESLLPILSKPFSSHALKIKDDCLIVIDLNGNERMYPWQQVFFAAAGRLHHLTMKAREKEEPIMVAGISRGMHATYESVVEHKVQDAPEFRLEIFLSEKPSRISFLLTKKVALKINGTSIILNNREKLNQLMKWLADALPPSRTNMGIRKAATNKDYVYPSLKAFEEEIVWSLYQLNYPSANFDSAESHSP